MSRHRTIAALLILVAAAIGGYDPPTDR